MNDYRFVLEKYRGRNTRYRCPQCGRKYTFTRYVDTHDNNSYISDIVGKCNRLDKCGYHYTPRQFFADNPWRSRGYDTDNYQPRRYARTPPPVPPAPRPIMSLPRYLMERSLRNDSAFMRWFVGRHGERAKAVARSYYVGGLDDRVIFWQVDGAGRVRTGKVMEYDQTGHRVKEEGSCTWMHAVMRSQGALPEGWELTQCLYGEHLLGERRGATVAVVEAAKTALVGAVLFPEMVWVAVDSMTGLTEQRLAPLAGRNVILFPDEGRGMELWSKRIASIASAVGFRYRISEFMEGRASGSDIADLEPTEGADYDVA